MTTTRLAEVLGVPAWPEDYQKDFDRFQSEWEGIRTRPLLDWDAVKALADEGFINPDMLPDAEACLEKIASDEELHFALQCVYYALCVYRGPHQNELYIDPAPPSLAEYRFTFPMIVLMKCMVQGIENARRHGVPEALIAQHKGAANGDVCEGGHYGTPGMFHWRCVCSFCTMYSLGAFRYEPERVPPGYRMLRRKADGKLLMLYTTARRFDEFGQFASSDEQVVFESVDAVGKTDGYVILPDGRVIDRYVALSEDEWEVALDSGDAALSFHIPPSIPYNVQAMGDSFRQAIDFFRTYYPDYNVRSIQSYSWLYSPQLKDMLPETSGINRLNRELYLAPVPSGPDGFHCFVFNTGSASFDVDTAPTDTGLRRAFVAFVKNGGRVHNGFMYFPASDVGRFCDDAHTLYAWDAMKE